MSRNSLAVQLSFDGTEVLAEAAYPGAAADSSRRLQLNANPVNATLNDSSVPTIAAPALQIKGTLGASATIIDLTAGDIGVGRSYDFTGLSVVAILLTAPVSNTGPITVQPAPANGYALFGPGGVMGLYPGTDLRKVVNQVASGYAQVSPTAKDIQIVGTENDRFDLFMWFGN